MKMLPLFKTYLPPNTTRRVREVVNSGWVGCGKETEEFEKEFGTRFGQQYCIATNSCTSALHLAYELLDLVRGDEIIAPVFTCTATNIPIVYAGGKIVFADIDPSTFNIDPDDVERKITPKTRAIVVVHWGGYAADMDRIMAIAKKHKLKVIVDAAHALGATYNGKDISDYGDYICYSFQAIKQITTIEGGMLVVKAQKDYERANIMRWYGIDRLGDRDSEKRYIALKHVGWRYIPNDVFMAIGRIQLAENLDRVIEHRRKIASLYYKLLAGHPRILLLANEASRESTYWLFTVVCENRDELRKLLADHGVATGMAHFRNDISLALSPYKLPLPNMDAFEKRYVCLPIHMGVTERDVRRICKILWDKY